MKHNPRTNEEWRACRASPRRTPWLPRRCPRARSSWPGRLEQILDRADGARARDAAAFGRRAGGARRHPHGPQGAGEGGPRRGTTVLIPDSAHGTNPASAHFAGYKVRELKSNARGTIDLAVLEAAMTEDVAALMLTVPNTLGVFEDRILDIARIVHAKGGVPLLRRRQLQRLRGRRQARAHGRRRHAHEPPQDLLDAARRRRAGLGPGGGGGAARARSCRGPTVETAAGRDLLPRRRPARLDRPAAHVPRQLRDVRARSRLHRGLRQPHRRGRPGRRAQRELHPRAGSRTSTT